MFVGKTLNLDFIPDGKSGNWSVSTYTVKEDDIYRQFFNELKYGRSVPPGTYRKLLHFNDIVMSNTPNELGDHQLFVAMATGHVLINGLGLGCCLTEVLLKKEVTKVTVVEKSQDVVNLVWPYFKDPRLELVIEDAFNYQPPKGVKYGAVWHDIWPTICGDNYPEIKKLEKKFQRKTNWQGSWCKNRVKFLNLQDV